VPDQCRIWLEECNLIDLGHFPASADYTPGHTSACSHSFDQTRVLLFGRRHPDAGGVDGRA